MFHILLCIVKHNVLNIRKKRTKCMLYLHSLICFCLYFFFLLLHLHHSRFILMITSARCSTMWFFFLLFSIHFIGGGHTMLYFIEREYKTKYYEKNERFFSAPFVLCTEMTHPMLWTVSLDKIKWQKKNI